MISWKSMIEWIDALKPSELKSLATELYEFENGGDGCLDRVSSAVDFDQAQLQKVIDLGSCDAVDLLTDDHYLRHYANPLNNDHLADLGPLIEASERELNFAKIHKLIEACHSLDAKGQNSAFYILFAWLSDKIKNTKTRPTSLDQATEALLDRAKSYLEKGDPYYRVVCLINLSQLNGMLGYQDVARKYLREASNAQIATVTELDGIDASAIVIREATAQVDFPERFDILNPLLEGFKRFAEPMHPLLLKAMTRSLWAFVIATTRQRP
ncbi:MAG: hypothetical protein AAF585_08900 [Verrucomicrobiota bacterium]